MFFGLAWRQLRMRVSPLTVSSQIQFPPLLFSSPLFSGTHKYYSVSKGDKKNSVAAQNVVNFSRVWILDEENRYLCKYLGAFEFFNFTLDTLKIAFSKKATNPSIQEKHLHFDVKSVIDSFQFFFMKNGQWLSNWVEIYWHTKPGKLRRSTLTWIFVKL